MSIYSKLNWKKILEIDTSIYDNLDKHLKNRRIGGILKNLFFEIPSIDEKNSNTKVLFFKSMYRDDYNQKFKEIYNLKNHEKKIIDIQYRASGKVRIYPLYIFIRYLPLILMTNYSSNIKRMFYLMLCQVKYLEIAKKVFKNDFKYLVVFADMQAMDNMLCQIAKQKKIPTVTLQHGLYVDYENNFNVNIVNYKNHVADYFLSWGEDTKNLIEKYHPNSKVMIVGKSLEKSENKKVKVKDYFTVVFDQNLFHEYNKQILDICYNIAKKMDLKINLRLHPNNKVNWYKIDKNIIMFDQELNNSIFVVGHTTSMLYELMRLGIPSYKFRSDMSSNELDEQFKFSTISELEDNIINHRKIQYDFSAYAKRYIKYIGDESLQKYKDFFKGLENGKY